MNDIKVIEAYKLHKDNLDRIDRQGEKVRQMYLYAHDMWLKSEEARAKNVNDFNAQSMSDKAMVAQQMANALVAKHNFDRGLSFKAYHDAVEKAHGDGVRAEFTDENTYTLKMPVELS